MKNNKASGVDRTQRGIIKCTGEVATGRLFKLVSSMYETGKCKI